MSGAEVVAPFLSWARVDTSGFVGHMVSACDILSWAVEPDVRVSKNHCAMQNCTIKATWLMGKMGLEKQYSNS